MYRVVAESILDEVSVVKTVFQWLIGIFEDFVIVLPAFVLISCRIDGSLRYRLEFI